jgi:tetratricopeptide (TPR) repeat protein
MTSFKSILFLLLAVALASCAKNLELQPAQSISEGLALGSDANVKTVLVGAYDALSNGDLYGGNTMRDADLLGGNGEVRWVGTFNGPRQIFNKQIEAGNGDAQERWLESYEAINIVNNVLAALEVVNAADRERVEGEALFLRGLLYFDLVRYYSLPYATGGGNDQLGVPLVLTPTRSINAETNVSRSTVEAGYAQVLSDLERAATLLPADNGFFATSLAAKAILARVYLQMGRFTDARDNANDVITSGEFSLTDTYAEAFMNDANSSEDIFAIQVSNQDGTNNLNLFYSIPEFGGRDGDIEILDDHLARYEDGDARKALFFERAGSTLSGKFNSQFANVTVVRLAEMHLIRAEANQRLGTAVGLSPAAEISALRMRSDLAAVDEVSLDDIIDERVRELAFEGFFIHDLKRLQRDAGNFAYDAPELVFPVPSREIVANPNLVQNPGY